MSAGFYRVGANSDPLNTRKRYIAAFLADPLNGTVHDMSLAETRPFEADMLIGGEPEVPHPPVALAVAKQQGYTGNQCTMCYSMRMVVSGHCEVCQDCGSSSGCS